MSKIISPLNKKEKSVRKFWLGFAIFYKFIYPLSYFIISSILTYNLLNIFSNIDEFKNLASPSLYFTNFLHFLKMAAINALVFWWVYHCAYKKSGTALLLFFLIINPFFFILCLSSTFLFWFMQNFPKLAEFWSELGVHMGTDGNTFAQFMKNSIHYTMSLFVLESILTVVWFIACLKLRNVNKKLKTVPSTETV